jgi:hypothetical protein
MAQIHPGTQEVRISDLETPTPVHIHQVLWNPRTQKDECILLERMGNFHWRQRSRESTKQKKVEDIYIYSQEGKQCQVLLHTPWTGTWSTINHCHLKSTHSCQMFGVNLGA